MKIHPTRSNCLGSVLLVILLLTSGCATVDSGVALSEQKVTPMATGEAADVQAEDLAVAMLRAGFSREDILKHGPVLRNALATSGSAQIRNSDSVSALFAIFGNQLYVTSRMRGTFVEQLQ